MRGGPGEGWQPTALRELHQGNLRLPTPPFSLECTFFPCSHTRSHFKALRVMHCWGHLHNVYDWTPYSVYINFFFNNFNFLLLFNYSCIPFLPIPPPHPVYKLFKTLLERCRNLLLLPMPKTSLVGKFPSLINLPPTKLEWPSSFCSLSLPSAYAVPFWISPAGSSLGSEPTRV